jgi:hypothetical protein
VRKEKKKKGQDLLVGRFYITLNLEVGREYVICGPGGGGLESREGAVPDSP